MITRHTSLLVCYACARCTPVANIKVELRRTCALAGATALTFAASDGAVRGARTLWDIRVWAIIVTPQGHSAGADEQTPLHDRNRVPHSLLRCEGDWSESDLILTLLGIFIISKSMSSNAAQEWQYYPISQSIWAELGHSLCTFAKKGLQIKAVILSG